MLFRFLFFFLFFFFFFSFFLSFQYTADRLFTLYIFRTLKAPSPIHSRIPTHILFQFTPLHIVILRVFSFCRRCEFLSLSLSFSILCLSTSIFTFALVFPFLLLRCCFVVYDYFLLCWYGWEKKEERRTNTCIRREHQMRTAGRSVDTLYRFVCETFLLNWYSNKTCLIPHLRRSFLQRKRKLDVSRSLDLDGFPLNRHCDHSSIRHAQYG